MSYSLIQTEIQHLLCINWFILVLKCQKMLKFGQKLTWKLIFGPTIQVKNGFFASFKFKSQKGPYIGDTLRQKLILWFLLTLGVQVTPPPYRLKWNNSVYGLLFRLRIVSLGESSYMIEQKAGSSTRLLNLCRPPLQIPYWVISCYWGFYGVGQASSLGHLRWRGTARSIGKCVYRSPNRFFTHVFPLF